MLTVHKAACCVIQNQSLLCFEHPLAGKQIPKGTVDCGESAEQACLRELTEETGLVFEGTPTPLGVLERKVGAGPNEDGALELHVWHIFKMPFFDLPDTWIHVAVGSPAEQGLAFRFFWQPLNAAPLGFDEIYVRTIELVRRNRNGLASR